MFATKLMHFSSVATRKLAQVRFASSNFGVVVDIHSHFLPHSWPDFSAKFGDASGPWPWMRHDAKNASQAMLMLGEKEFRPVNSRCWDISLRLKDMQADGVDYQIISNTPLLFQYHRPIQQSLDVAMYFNDLAMSMTGEGAGHIYALAQVPLQDIDASCKEASRAMSIGHKGVQIGNHVGPLDLDNEGLITFLTHCANEEIPVLVHPWDMLGGDRLEKYMMAWTVGMPCETHLSIATMILGGAFDRLPHNLRICFAHGGGAFAFLLPRMENAWKHRDIARGKSEHPPSHYTNRFSVDSAVFGDGALSLLVETMGASNVMLGSDYPYPLGEHGVGSLIKNSKRLTAETKAMLLGGNAMKFWKLDL